MAIRGRDNAGLRHEAGVVPFHPGRVVASEP
jgi:hypothetical protein